MKLFSNLFRQSQSYIMSGRTEEFLKTANTDNELMERVRDGDVKLLGELFERHAEKLHGFFVRHTNRRDAGDDLVQDVFFRMLKYRHTYRGDAPFTVWMYQLARNAAADYFRKWKREYPTAEIPEAHLESEAGADEMMEQKERARFLQAALKRLEPAKREVLLLSRYQELKYDEIGKILDCPVGTVKARVHFALKDLREEYFKLSGEKTIE
jgi:RNA polymerase sigma-70 factor (ECF subfamily)